MSVLEPQSPKTYFLALGAGRGGTTLLANCLDSHPGVGCLNEVGDDALRGKHGPVYGGLRLMARISGLSRIAPALEHWADRHPEAVRFKGGSRPARLEHAGAFWSEIHPQLAAHAQRIAGDKITTDSLAMIYRSPFESDESPLKDRFKQTRLTSLAYFCNELFARYRFVFIVRDGRRVIQSKMRRGGASLTLAAAHWRECAYIHRALSEILDTRMLTVTYEALVAEPRQTLGRLCSFLEVELDDQMLAGARRPYAGESRWGFNTEEIGWVPPDGGDELIREGLGYFGYAASALDEPN